jgi:hypothetical protein
MRSGRKLLAAAAVAVPLAMAAPLAAGAGTHPAAGLAHRTPAATFSGPVINTGGVVNGVDYSASDIHPATTVAIFGEWFLPPDTVTVTQGSAQYTIGAGSTWWYDSGGQINATLPGSLQPGPAAVTVTTAAGQQSNVAPVTIQP